MFAQPAPSRPWVGLSLIIALIFTATFMYYYQFIVVPAQVAQARGRNIVIFIEAFQFGFKANGTEVSVDKPIEVRLNDNITFIITATFEREAGFMQHGFFIQGLMEEPLAITEGEEVRFNLIADKIGEFLIMCTIYCGTGHGGMVAGFRVKP